MNKFFEKENIKLRIIWDDGDIPLLDIPLLNLQPLLNLCVPNAQGFLAERGPKKYLIFKIEG